MIAAWIILAITVAAITVAWVLTPTSEPIWVVDSNDFPPGMGHELTPEERAAFEQDWAPYHAAAMASLAETVVPEGGERS